MIVVDVETTSLDTQNGSIVSIGALDLNEPTEQFYDECRIWEGAKVEDEALAINGFSREEIADLAKKTEGELIASFVAWACMRENMTLAAQNVSFDFAYIQEACKRARVDFPFAKRTVDVHSLVWMHMTQKGREAPVRNHHSVISLDFALEYCGLPKEPRPHNALTGAYAHAEVIARVAYNKSILPDYSSFPIPWTPLEAQK